jgi:hypothetical protein
MFDRDTETSVLAVHAKEPVGYVRNVRREVK